MDDFRQDNPGGDWLKRKQEHAEKTMGEYKGLRGNPTGFFKKPIELPTSHLEDIKGAEGEHNFRNHGSKLQALEKTVGHPSNFNTKNNPVMIRVNHRGEAYAWEGNHRIAYAAKHGIKTVHAEVTYHNGGEDVDGPWHPQKLQSIRHDVKEHTMVGFKQFIKEGNKFNVNMTHRDIVGHITQRGWYLERQKGDHDVYGHNDATHKLAVPRHKGDLAPGTVRQIVKNSEVMNKKSQAA